MQETLWGGIEVRPLQSFWHMGHICLYAYVACCQVIVLFCFIE